MDFVAIDFETANNKRSSACSIGFAIVSGNKIIDTKHFLIRPEPFFFHPFNVQIHGITEDAVSDAPTLAELWSLIEGYISGKLLVAHNASFDVSVLKNTLDVHGIKWPEFDYICTYRLSQLLLPSSGNFRLSTIAAKLDIPLDHHNAESDAAACARILCRFIEDNELSTLSDFSSKLGFVPGYVKRYTWGDDRYDYSPCRLKGDSSTSHGTRKLRAADFLSEEPVYVDDDFNGKNFVFTGTLLSMPRSKAYEIVAKGGGTPQDNLTKKTNYLVVGLSDFYSADGMSGKMRKAYDYRSKGQDIQILSEDDFLSLIDDELYQQCNI